MAGAASPPKTPKESINSRRSHIGLHVEGFCFEIEGTKPTEAIKVSQRLLVAKARRQAPHNYKEIFWPEDSNQEYLHATFLPTVGPTRTRTEYQNIKGELLCKGNPLMKAHWTIECFLKSNRVFASVKECKLNSDGHMVVRIDLQPAEELFELKKELKSIFGNPPDRHSGSDKQTTLAIVLGVVDYKAFPNPVEMKCFIEDQLSQLQTELAKLGKFPLDKIVHFHGREERSLPDGNRNVLAMNNRSGPSSLLMAYMQRHAEHEENKMHNETNTFCFG